MLTQVGKVLTTKDPQAIQTPQNSSLGKDDFLKLLIAQIKNQDPINPISPKEFTQQLTALAQLEQEYNFTDTLKQFGSVIESLNKTNLLSLLEKKVKVEEGIISTDGSIKANYTLPVNAETVKVTILDESGQTVKEWEIHNQGAGTYSVKWDGRDKYGNPLNGVFKVKVEATANGKKVENVALYSVGTVTAVDIKDEAVIFGNFKLPISKVVEVLS